MNMVYTYHTIPGEEVLRNVSAQLTDLGSAISADCLTLPQYVERSYCDAGSSLLPGKEADMLGSTPLSS